MRLLIALMILLGLLLSAGALADGMIFPVERPNSSIVVPDQLFTVKYHYVDVDIKDQLCTTKVDQIFHNDTNTEREGMYIFPMPEGSAITKFSMFAGENEIMGKVLDKNEARSIYESIVRQRKDPAILEYIDRNTFRARVFPIPANDDKRIRLSYAEVATKTGNTYRYVYPLSTERFSARPLESCRVTIRLTAKRPITNIYSPTHTLDIERVSDTEAVVKWEVKDSRPDTDMVIYYTISESPIGMDIVTYRKSGEPGYFMLLASPKVGMDKAAVQSKNVVFVLDRTGSMAGEKLDQAKAALKFCINTLKPQDRFNVITFNESPSLMFPEMMKPAGDARSKALDEVDRIDSTGSTDINLALKKAKEQFASLNDQRNYIVFLTDGQPTAGETDPNAILKNAKMDGVKLFIFGVGYDVNAHLLDKLADENHGSTDYVRPRENIEAKVSSFFAKVSDPILADLKLEISGVRVSDQFPTSDLPDIFSGTQLIVFGRYTDSGHVRVTLSGKAGGATKTFVLDTDLPNKEDSNEFIPQLWASRKIGYLLDQIRLHSNQELIDEVIRLSKTYGIPTEYTSFLADERQDVAKLRGQTEIVRRKATLDASTTVGKDAVRQSANARGAESATLAPQAKPATLDLYASNQIGKTAANGRIGGYYQDKNDRTVIVANVQNIASRTFYQRGDYWEDAELKPNQKVVQIKQFSDAHFKLIKAYPKLSQFSTLGNLRLIMANNQAVEIGPNGKETLTSEELKNLAGN